MNRSVVMCGLGRVGWRVLDSLRTAGWTVTVVDIHVDASDPRLEGVRCFRGDCRNPALLEQAGIAQAHGVVIVTSDDLVNVSTALLIRKLNPTARLVVRMFNQNLITRLGAAVSNTIALSVSALTAPFIALAAVTGEALAAVNVNELPQQIVEYEVPPDSPITGSRLSDVARVFQVLVLAHTTASGRRSLLQSLDPSQIVSRWDRLVVCGSPQAIARLIGDKDDSLFTSVLWAGKIRRSLRLLRRTLVAIDKPALITTLVLLGTLAASTITFHYGVEMTWAESFYRTVSLMATATDMHGDGQAEWVKFFVAGLKLVGVALIAAFTAVFTNSLLKARLGGVFEASRIPDGGHVVVCGLGNIGFRCIQELVRMGCQVVAVEKTVDNAFAATVRRMGVAVITGDATVSEVLKQARVDKARAVIAATSAELANLEVALLVREINPTQRVVVRISDPDFAQAAREAADIKHAVSPPALAASAFVAGLYGDKVQALFAVERHSLAIVDLRLEDPDHSFLDRSLRELIIDYRFTPLGLRAMEPFTTSGVPYDYRLKAGDQLTMALAVRDLERIGRRERPASNCEVVVESFPISAREELAILLRSAQSCDPQTAEELLKQLPLTFATGLTRGQAEAWLARLTRERVVARVNQV